jgi:hypothetical protein
VKVAKVWRLSRNYPEYSNYESKTVKKIRALLIIKTANGGQKLHEMAMSSFAWYRSVWLMLL